MVVIGVDAHKRTHTVVAVDEAGRKLAERTGAATPDGHLELLSEETSMGKVVTGASMSLDGYVSGPDESGFDHLFAWYGNGDVSIPTAQPDRTFHMTVGSARVWTEFSSNVGALVVGRRTFDVTDGWGGLHPLGVPVFVVTHRVPKDWPHPDAPFTFVTDGVERAIEQAQVAAGGKDVSITAGTIAAQALRAGLLDEIWVMLTPVLLGGGRPFFPDLYDGPVALVGPDVIQGAGVTHLRYRVERPSR
jgi:dihydrofolate reductase